MNSLKLSEDRQQAEKSEAEDRIDGSLVDN